MALPDYPSLKPGYTFPTRELIRDQERQDRKLRACSVDAETYQGVAATGLFGNECFRLMHEVGQDIDGFIHTRQRYRQHGSIMIEEPITLSGATVSAEPVPRGLELHQVFEFTRKNGDQALTAEITGIVPDPDLMNGPRGEEEGQAFNPVLHCICLEQKYLQPAQVEVFSADVGNQIHTNPEFANSYGYDAPIAQGLMTAAWMMATMADFAPPKKFDATFEFLRPVFWDDEMALWAKPSIDIHYDTVFSVNGDGKPTAVMTVSEIEH